MADLIVETMGLLGAFGALWMMTHMMGRAWSPSEKPGQSALFAAAVAGATVIVITVLLATVITDPAVPFTPLTMGVGGMVGVLVGTFTSYGANRRAAS